MQTGIITHWVAAKGFGFIRRDDGQPDTFCHISEVDADVDELRVGQRVCFVPGTDPRSGRSRACDVKLIE